MIKLEEIKKSVEKLSPEELAEFRSWFEQFDAALFDSRIERDILAGKLDRFAAEALQASGVKCERQPCFMPVDSK
jgi:hypothetical protein